MTRLLAERATTSLWHELAGHRSRLTALAGRWGMTAEDAEDAASEVMARAAASVTIDATRLGEALSTAVHRYRGGLVLRADSEAYVRGREGPTVRPSDRPVEDEVVGRHYLRALLATAGLTAQEESVVALVVTGHLRTEVAGWLGLTAKASQRSLDRARSKLRRALRTEVAPGETGSSP